jgi:glycerol kinase
LKNLKQRNINSGLIKCLGVTNQRETVLAWNKITGKPYHNALVWNDARTAEIC